MIAPLNRQMRLPLVLRAQFLLARHSNGSATDGGGIPGNISLTSVSSNSSDSSNIGAKYHQGLNKPRPISMTPPSIATSQRQKAPVMPVANGNPNGLEREYLEAVRELNGLQSNSRVLSLAKYNKPQEILPHVRKQLHFAGIDVNDLDRLNAIHITGTKGKGSTCVFLESILRSNTIETDERGKRIPKVGCYTSPHLIHVTERIRLDGRPIDRALFVRNFWHVFNLLKAGTEREQLAMPNYFTFLTILAFYTFLEEQIDCAIIEVGIGGEFDPTNVLVKPVACAITTLDLDHTNILGPTLKSIAWTKAGIIKPDVPMFTVDHDQFEATQMIKCRAELSNSPVHICKPLSISHDQQLGIEGNAQATNASIACELASCLLNRLYIRQPQANRSQPLGLSIGFTSQEIECETLPESFQRGLRRAQFPGRCQIVDSEKVSFFIDGAHTRKSMKNCLVWFYVSSIKKASLDHQYRYLMINIIGDRDRREVLEPLLMYCKLFRKLIFTSNRIDTIQVQDKTADDTYSPPQLPFHEKGLENVLNNAKVWNNLIKDKGVPHFPKAEVHATISESLQVIFHDYASTSSTRNSEDHSMIKPHILATGSLHFVGAVLEAIEKFREDG